MNSYGRGYPSWRDYYRNYQQGQQWEQQYGEYGQIPWYRHLMGEQLPPWQIPKTGPPWDQRPIPLPSGHAWSRMAPSERKGYWGMAGPYGEGEEYSDLGWYLSRMMPSWDTPNYPRFNRSRW